MIVVLAGGVGAAKFLQGLVQIVDPEELSVIVNTADDIELHGLSISPDLDIIMYTLAGIVDESQGWGIKNDTTNCLEMLKKYNQKVWFKLGDKDLATHIYRTQLMRSGHTLTETTKIMCKHLGVKANLIPMTNEKVATKIRTPSGVIHFEEFMIERRAQDEVLEIIYDGAENARPVDGVLDIIKNCEGILIGPSNPLVSINTILSVNEVGEAIKKSNKPIIGVSPIVGNKPVKGPLDKLMKGLGMEVSCVGVAKFYKNLIRTFIIDEIDKEKKEIIEDFGLKVIVTNTIMKNLEIKKNLAQIALNAMKY
ncbi:MAG: 2-phospho-L-lactate transferase [Candidatus Helarchaeota archaeon]